LFVTQNTDRYNKCRNIEYNITSWIATDYGLEGAGIESRWGEIFRSPDRPWGPHILLHNGYRVFPGGKVRPEPVADHSPPSSAAVMEE